MKKPKTMIINAREVMASLRKPVALDQKATTFRDRRERDGRKAKHKKGEQYD